MKEQYTSLLREIEDSVSRIEESAEPRTRSLKYGQDTTHLAPSNLTISAPPPRPVSPHPHAVQEDEARLPCYIPPTFRPSKFFDRDEIILEMEEFFDGPVADDSLKTLALFGLGGVGKSSVALKYAEKKIKHNELDAMFWVPSERLVTIQQTFTTIAQRLRLSDARATDHSENQALVINWLQNTRKFIN